MIAREKGLETLARILVEQNGTDPKAAAAAFVDPEKAVDNIDAALVGARDIIIENMMNPADGGIRYYGYYSNKSHGLRKKAGADDQVPALIESEISSKDNFIYRR